MELNLFPIIGLTIISAMICLLLRQYKPEYALSASIVCGIVILIIVITQLSPILDTITSILDRIKNGNQYTGVIIKAIGICYVVQLAADTCKDAGESAMAGRIELIGRISILIISLPMLMDLIGIITDMIG